MVELRRVDEALVAASAAAVSWVAAELARLGAAGDVVPLGSSNHLGALTRGDLDVLVRPPSHEAFKALEALVVADDRASGAWAPAQRENWTDVFTSWTATGPDGAVGVQVVVAGSDLDRQLGQQMAALDDPVVRRRYDRAKEHGADLPPEGYWAVKDLFWRSRALAGPSWDEPTNPVCKVLRPDEWDLLLRQGVFVGSPDDLADGFVHLSTPAQVPGTIERHFTGAGRGLWLLTLDADALGRDLRWEASRRGEDFPHLYAPLQLSELRLARPVA